MRLGQRTAAPLSSRRPTSSCQRQKTAMCPSRIVSRSSGGRPHRIRDGHHRRRRPKRTKCRKTDAVCAARNYSKSRRARGFVRRAVALRNDPHAPGCCRWPANHRDHARGIGTHAIVMILREKQLLFSPVIRHTCCPPESDGGCQRSKASESSTASDPRRNCGHGHGRCEVGGRCEGVGRSHH